MNTDHIFQHAYTIIKEKNIIDELLADRQRLKESMPSVITLSTASVFKKLTQGIEANNQIIKHCQDNLNEAKKCLFSLIGKTPLLVKHEGEFYLFYYLSVSGDLIMQHIDENIRETGSLSAFGFYENINEMIKQYEEAENVSI